MSILIPLLLPKSSTYIKKIVATSPFIYFPLNETTGTAAVNQGTLGTSANGTYTGVDLANVNGPKLPYKAPYFDGANDWINVESSALNGAYNGQLGTLAIWIKAYDASFWTDSLNHWIVRFDKDSGANYVQLLKYTDNKIYWEYNSNSVTKTIGSDAYKNTNWQMMACTWSLAADEVKAYMNSVQVGSTATGLGTWSGGSLENAHIGCLHHTPTFPMKGYLAHCAMWARVLSQPELLSLV